MCIRDSLCNDLCSLRPDEDRLAFTVDIELDAQGRVRTYEPYPSVIRSRVRMDYGAADALLREGDPDGAAPVSYTHLDVYKRQRPDAPAFEDAPYNALCEQVLDFVKHMYDAKAERLGSDLMGELDRQVMLRVIDTRWMGYLQEMDYLKPVSYTHLTSKIGFLDIEFEERTVDVKPSNVKEFEIQYQAPGSSDWRCV